MILAAWYLREAERLALKAGTPYYLMQVYLCYSRSMREQRITQRQKSTCLKV